MKFATKAIHAGQEPDPTTGAIMTPIYQTSTYVQAAPGDHKGYEYARTQNPTRTALETNLAALENGNFAYCFGSGMAATDSVARMLLPGDEEEFEVWAFHKASIGLLKQGIIVINNEQSIVISKGVVKVNNNELVALVEE